VNEETTLLFRPVGPKELELLATSGWQRWPPRLPEQPIFYPVTNFAYAAEIASKWNVAESGAGHVTRFRVRADFMNRFEIQRVGASYHTEWWIPSEQLEELNANIVGRIEVIASFGVSVPAVTATPALTIETVSGDLLHQNVEVIVNAWNRNFIPWWLLLPQGVSGAIKRAAGVAPFRELRRRGVLRVGDAVVTAAGRLKFRAILHVAGLNALWRSSEPIVRTCIKNALAVAREHNFASIAFPLLGAGTGGLDSDEARQIIVDEISRSAYNGHVIVVTWRSAG
jgi:O-acetyl-ADP-ribose deacetylase